MPTYLVKHSIKEKSEERLIAAQNKAAAIRHVADETIKCELAEVPDIMRLAVAGVKVENASD